MSQEFKFYLFDMIVLILCRYWFQSLDALFGAAVALAIWTYVARKDANKTEDELIQLELKANDPQRSGSDSPVTAR